MMQMGRGPAMPPQGPVGQPQPQTPGSSGMMGSQEEMPEMGSHGHRPPNPQDVALIKQAAQQNPLMAAIARVIGIL